MPAEVTKGLVLMATERKKIDLGMSGYNELFMNDAKRTEIRLPRIHEIPISEIDTFPGHPYKVQDDEDMVNLVESIKECGVITPATVHKKENGRYELISGHRRKRACELAGLETMRCDVVVITNDEAVVMMVDANCQQSKVLPSEKAYAYKMKLEAIKHQGQRSDLTSRQAGEKLAADRVSDTESGRQVQRYIRLTCLEQPLLNLVDEGEIALSPAVELSYLTVEEQNALIETIEGEDCTPSLSQASRLRKMSEDGTLTVDSIVSIMSEIKGNQIQMLKIPINNVRKYFPGSYSSSQIENEIIKICKDYSQKRSDTERQRRDYYR